MIKLKLSLKLLAILVGCISLAHSQTLEVEVGGARSPQDAMAASDHAVRQFNRSLGLLTRNQRAALQRAGRYNPKIPLSFPTTVWLTSNGQRLGVPSRTSGRGGGAALNLIFDPTFPNEYRDFLIAVYNQAEPFLTALFGAPSVGGDVAVKNFDASIGDREVVTGGYYVPNSPGTPEIRFPVYGSVADRDEVIAVNFIHTLLLAYIGPNQYGFDAFNEGIVRAVTMRIARTPAALPAGLESDLIEQVLTNSYDVEGFYDWYNQRALGGPKFIAPNLRDVPLPDAGSVGGLYLLRYKMAGSAWIKALVEIPGFIASYNAGFYSQPAMASDVPALVALGQSTLNNLRPGDATIEGMSFAEWFRRQFILETNLTRGPKLLVEHVPIDSGLSGSDYGVFIIQANWFETLAGGNETLLSGTSYPIIWEGNVAFNRTFPSTPDAERMDLAGGYGAVVPNITNLYNQPYRAAVDVPIQDQTQRVYLPVGGIATASNPAPRDFYGTIVGAELQTGDTLRLQVSVNGVAIPDVPVTRNAYGELLNTPNFLGNARLVVSVVRNRQGADTVLLTRRVNKGPGSLALDLRVDGEVSLNPNGGLPKGISALGFPVDPFLSLNGQVLNIPENQVLAARFNSSKAKYDLYPDLEPFKIGHGYFVRMNAAQPGFTMEGRVHRNVEASTALKPGWNLIANPLLVAVPTNRVRVVKAAESPSFWVDAAGVDVGTDFFEFQPGPPDPATGAPETGTMVAATQFEPGKAYFVRVLAPEGVSLSFQPPSGGQTPSQMSSVPSQTGWQMALTLKYGRTQSAKAIIGQSTTATRSFDAREDSGMPPAFGSGFQIIVEDYEQLYRDIRPLAGGEVYSVKLQGLHPGKVHQINFTKLFGTTPTLQLRDSQGRSLGTMSAGSTFNYFARNSTEYIRIVVGGTR